MDKNTTPPRSIPELIRDYRKAHDLSQREFAIQIDEAMGGETNIKKQSVSQWEKGQTRPGGLLVLMVIPAAGLVSKNVPLAELFRDIREVMKFEDMEKLKQKQVEAIESAEKELERLTEKQLEI